MSDPADKAAEEAARKDAEEMAKTQEVSAIYANRFYVAVGSEVVRIAFGEVVGDADATYRSAIVLRTGDARALVDVLSRAFLQLPK